MDFALRSSNVPQLWLPLKMADLTWVHSEITKRNYQNIFSFGEKTFCIYLGEWLLTSSILAWLSICRKSQKQNVIKLFTSLESFSLVFFSLSSLCGDGMLWLYFSLTVLFLEALFQHPKGLMTSNSTVIFWLILSIQLFSPYVCTIGWGCRKRTVLMLKWIVWNRTV